MQQFQNYILGNWVSGSGIETSAFHAITGTEIGTVSSAGIDFEAVLNYGRKMGGLGGGPGQYMSMHSPGVCAAGKFRGWISLLLAGPWFLLGLQST